MPSPTAPANPASTAPSLAIITNGPTPYRTHFHLRIVREITELRLLSIFTHEVSNSPWSLKLPAEINPIMFGGGQVATESTAKTLRREWVKGGEVIKTLAANNVRAVVVYGYADPGRLRIIRWCRANRIPCFMWGDSNIRGDVQAGLKSRVKQMILKRILNLCTGVMCCGSLGQQYFERYGVPTDEIYWVPYEPDYALLHSLTVEQIESARARFNLDPARKRIVFSARMVHVKRADLAIDSFIQIAGKRTDWDLLMLGDGPLRTAIEARVPANLKSRVIWAGFIDDQSVVSALYRNCDVLLLPSDYEPWALVINEAAAAGLAIVASDVVGAAAELVRDGVNGFLFPAGNLAALTEALLKATNPEHLNDLKAGSYTVLKQWREKADPVDGLRLALTDANVI